MIEDYTKSPSEEPNREDPSHVNQDNTSNDPYHGTGSVLDREDIEQSDLRALSKEEEEERLGMLRYWAEKAKERAERIKNKFCGPSKKFSYNEWCISVARDPYIKAPGLQHHWRASKTRDGVQVHVRLGSSLVGAKEKLRKGDQKLQDKIDKKRQNKESKEAEATNKAAEQKNEPEEQG